MGADGGAQGGDGACSGVDVEPRAEATATAVVWSGRRDETGMAAEEMGLQTMGTAAAHRETTGMEAR